ncbi:hypothetical protein ACP7OL_000565 [Salmonella enterica subsp. enterica]
MTTNNHPAHGPVSLERLHQIREHLQHDNQYSNDRNRTYIIANVLKVIGGAGGAISSREAKAGFNTQPGYSNSLVEGGILTPIDSRTFCSDIEMFISQELYLTSVC